MFWCKNGNNILSQLTGIFILNVRLFVIPPVFAGADDGNAVIPVSYCFELRGTYDDGNIADYLNYILPSNIHSRSHCHIR